MAGAVAAKATRPGVVAPVLGDPVVTGPWRSPASPGAIHPGRSGPLTPEERELAQAAWRYFIRNTQTSTGLVNAVDGFPSTTMWDTASAVAGITAAQGLGLIDVAEATTRLGAIIDALQKITLFRNLCPNKAYNTISAERVDYANHPGEIGCSALDVGRLMAWMEIVSQRYPALAPGAHRAVAHWNPASMVSGGRMMGANVAPSGATEFDQEGRLGYEEYSAKAFRMWGFDTREAEKPQPYGLVTLYGIPVPFDTRDARSTGGHNFVVSEAAILDGVEFGWNEPDDTDPDPFDHAVGWFAAVANNIYAAQEARYENTRILTAKTEHQVAGPPYFVYDTLYSDGMPWVTITIDGVISPAVSALSAKAAIGLWALWRTPYTDKLLAAARTLETPDRGIQEGRLDSGAAIDITTANTNGIILETLLYKVQGRLHFPSAPEAPPPLLPPPGPAPAPPAAPASGPPPAPAPAPAPSPSRAAAVDGRAPAPPSAATRVTAGPGRHGQLTPAEAQAARIAWRYFENNTRAATGLVDAGEGYHSTTMWDTASAVAAIVCARQLELIDEPDAETRLRRIIAVLGELRLFHGECPNKAYDTVSTRPTDYSDRPAENGCSALDVGRLLIWMRIVRNRFPALREAAERTVAHWNIQTLVRGGELWGSTVKDGRAVFRQEGRLGYEQYAAKGYQLWGVAAPVSARPGAYAVSQIEGVPIAHDRRDGRNSGGHNYVVSETAVLDGLEFGWAPAGAATPDPWTVEAARNIFAAQENRHQHTGLLTARTEHQLLQAPHFVYDTLYSDGTPWATVDATGRATPGAAAVAAKAAFGLWALWPTPYADLLFEKVLPARDPDHGYYEGLLESGGDIRVFTANNNGVILEALAFKSGGGPLIRPLRL